MMLTKQSNNVDQNSKNQDQFLAYICQVNGFIIYFISRYRIMNLNSSRGSRSQDQPIDLRQAVEQQLDLILKMEEDRKALKKENKFLSQKLLSLNEVIRKYQVDTSQISVNTDPFLQLSQKNAHKIIQKESSQKQIQVDFEIDHPSTITTGKNNASKLSQAHSILKVLDASIANNQSKSFNHISESNLQVRENKRQGQEKKINNTNIANNKQITNEIVKMSKQINTLKRELKQADHRNKLKQKQLKDIKKCLETKSEALQKSRKDYNDLSNLMNTDKYKSVRNLENEIKALKEKLTSKDQNNKNGQLKEIKGFLAEITQQYQQYKAQTDKKIEILVSELASREKQNQDMKSEQKKLLKRLQLTASQL